MLILVSTRGLSSSFDWFKISCTLASFESARLLSSFSSSNEYSESSADLDLLVLIIFCFWMIEDALAPSGSDSLDSSI